MIGFYVYGWCWWYIIESLCYQPYFSRMGSKSEARNPSPLRRRWVARSQCNSVTFEYANVDHFKISFKKGAPIFVHIISYHMFLHISFFHIFFHMFSIYINIYICVCVQLLVKASVTVIWVLSICRSPRRKPRPWMNCWGRCNGRESDRGTVTWPPGGKNHGRKMRKMRKGCGKLGWFEQELNNLGFYHT